MLTSHKERGDGPALSGGKAAWHDTRRYGKATRAVDNGNRQLSTRRRLFTYLAPEVVHGRNFDRNPCFKGRASDINHESSLIEICLEPGPKILSRATEFPADTADTSVKVLFSCTRSFNSLTTGSTYPTCGCTASPGKSPGSCSTACLCTFSQDRRCFQGPFHDAGVRRPHNERAGSDDRQAVDETKQHAAGAPDGGTSIFSVILCCRKTWTSKVAAAPPGPPPAHRKSRTFSYISPHTQPMHTLAMPKSPSLTTLERVRKMFCVLRSLCRIFRSWMCFRASVVCTNLDTQGQPNEGRSAPRPGHTKSVPHSPFKEPRYGNKINTQ